MGGENLELQAWVVWVLPACDRPINIRQDKDSWTRLASKPSYVVDVL